MRGGIAAAGWDSASDNGRPGQTARRCTVITVSPRLPGDEVIGLMGGTMLNLVNQPDCCKDKASLLRSGNHLSSRSRAALGWAG